MEGRGYQATAKPQPEITQSSPRQAPLSASGSGAAGLGEHAEGGRGGVARGVSRMIIKEEGGSVCEETTQKKKKKKVKSTGSQTVVKIEDDLQSDTQAETKVKKKKCGAEEDSDQLNLSKKKKKVGSKLKKRACADSPVTIESSSEAEPVKEIKEESKVFKKKSKKGQGLSLLPLENNQDSDQYLPKKYTIHSQENTVIGKKHRESISQDCEGDNEVTKKKKKKKERDISSLPVIEIPDSDHEISNKNHKKINKTTLQEKALAGKKHRKDIVQNTSGESDVMKKKNKKKKDKHDSLTLAGNQDKNHSVSEENLSTRDFRKNQETNSQENTFIRKKQKEKSVQNSESDREVTKRKKKSKDFSSLTCEDNQDQSHGNSNKHLPGKQKAKSQEKALAGKKQRAYSEDDSEVTRKKKKKIQKEEEEVTEPVNLTDEDGEISEGEKMTPIKSNRKNKKKKSKPTEDLAVDNIDEGLHENNDVHCDNKGKKRNKQRSQNCAEEPRLKKKKVIVKTENEATECKDDVTVVTERKGNCDEINIDKVRRQALQEEIDRESGKTKVFRNKVESDIKFGQWSTASFENSDQKTKFLKLMGGFKKGSASSQDPPGTTEKPNMALNRKGEETLKQTLQMEFEKAVNLKQHRGIGLGFQPIANKKVYIDKYVSKSIKFED
ncbi:lysine-rich nucleolar protein 1 isoform X2 [Mauremys reevesii]|uniref:lysine-rich nucleolar protein 1 isoform X2 n=1 Tax=Mauremys reevesii TaxID=260615 RepID=UPI00193EC6D9|nr:lysine-rich nucleolar protein 1 isoform X2 [Mauremys reevesii]